jgi:hypothetical protein
MDDQGDPIDAHEKALEDDLNAKIMHLEGQIQRLKQTHTED